MNYCRYAAVFCPLYILETRIVDHASADICEAYSSLVKNPIFIKISRRVGDVCKANLFKTNCEIFNVAINRLLFEINFLEVVSLRITDTLVIFAKKREWTGEVENFPKLPEAVCCVSNR